MRWTACLVAALIAEVLAIMLAPILPLFSSPALGPVNNYSASARELRLPDWLSWFQTPDNSLLGDAAWQASHIWPGSHWAMTGWLLRNRAYGFKWSVLACEVDPSSISFSGDPRVNRNNGVTGLFRASLSGGYWQWKLVKPLIGNWGLMFNFGWQLNEFVLSEKPGVALFQFSPRFVSIKQGGV